MALVAEEISLVGVAPVCKALPERIHTHQRAQGVGERVPQAWVMAHVVSPRA